MMNNTLKDSIFILLFIAAAYLGWCVGDLIYDQLTEVKAKDWLLLRCGVPLVFSLSFTVIYLTISDKRKVDDQNM